MIYTASVTKLPEVRLSSVTNSTSTKFYSLANTASGKKVLQPVYTDG